MSRTEHHGQLSLHSNDLSCQLRWALSGSFTSSQLASAHQLARLQKSSAVSELISISAERL